MQISIYSATLNACTTGIRKKLKTDLIQFPFRIVSIAFSIGESKIVKKNTLYTDIQIYGFNLGLMFRKHILDSDFLIPISLQPNVVDLRYFKL